MKPPRRLLDGPITPDERRALSAGLALAAPAANKQRIWASLSAGLGTGVTVAAAKVAAGGSGALAATSQAASTSGAPLAGAGAAAKAAPLGLSLVKTLVTWTLIGSGLGVGAKLTLDHAQKVGALAQQTPTAQALTTVPPSAAHPRGTFMPQPSTGDSPQGGSKPSDAERRSAKPEPRALSKPTAKSANAETDAVRHSLALEQESRLVTRARTHLRSGQPRECLNVLGQVDAQFQKGWLEQERRALAIEAHAALGQQEQVRQLTRDFVSDYPDSPYASKVSEIAR